MRGALWLHSTHIICKHMHLRHSSQAPWMPAVVAWLRRAPHVTQAHAQEAHAYHQVTPLRCRMHTLCVMRQQASENPAPS